MDCVAGLIDGPCRKKQEEVKEIHLEVRGLAGLLRPVEVDASISIQELRQKLEEELGIPAKEQQLVVGTVPLDGQNVGAVLKGQEPAPELTVVRVEQESQEPSGWLDRDAWNWR